MKKFIALMVFVLSAQIVLAVDMDTIKQKAVSAIAQQTGVTAQTNIKQKQAETKIRKNLYTPQMLLGYHYTAFKQDKEIYDAGGDSMYGELLSIIKKNSALHTLDYKYAIAAKKLFDEILNWDDDIPAPAEFDKKKIIIPDSDFDKINDDLKVLIYMINTY